MKTLKYLFVFSLIYIFSGCSKDLTPQPAAESAHHKYDLLVKNNITQISPLAAPHITLRVLIALFGEQSISRNCKMIRITTIIGNKRYDSVMLTQLCPGFQCYYHPMKECYSYGVFDTTGAKSISVEADTIVSIGCPVDSFKIQVSEVSNNIITNYAFFSVKDQTVFQRIGQNSALTTYQNDSCSVAGVNLWNTTQTGIRRTMTIFLP